MRIQLPSNQKRGSLIVCSVLPYGLWRRGEAPVKGNPDSKQATV